MSLLRAPAPAAKSLSLVAPQPRTQQIDLAAKRLDLASYFTNTPPALDFIWPGFLRGTIGALVAAGSTGKSFWALEAAMCVASPEANAALLQLDVSSHGRVLYLNAEDGPDVLWHRLHAIAAHLPPAAREEAAAGVSLMPVVGNGVDIRSDAWTSAIVEAGKGTRLIILDTHSRWAAGTPENDNALQTEVVKRYESIAKATGAAVLFLHHSSKAMTLEGRQDEQGAARGASAITDASRYQAWMQTMTAAAAKEAGIPDRERSKYVSFGAAKVNAAAKPEPVLLQRQEGGVLLPMREREDRARAPDPLPAAPRSRSVDDELLDEMARMSPLSRYCK